MKKLTLLVLLLVCCSSVAFSQKEEVTKQTFTVNGVEFTMVFVEGGTFTMGATSEQGSDAYDWEKPAHCCCCWGASI